MEANEDGTVGGSHRVLVDLVLNVDRARVDPVVLFYEHNRYVEPLRAVGVHVIVYAEERKHESAVRAAGGTRKYLDYLGAIRRRLGLIRAEQIDVVHLNNSPRVGYDDWVPAARIAGVHVMAFAAGDANLQPWLARLSARHLDHIIAPSRYMAAAMEEVGVRAERLSTIHLGVDIARLRAAAAVDRTEVRTALGVGTDDVLAIMVGNVREWKGQHVVIDAYRQLPPDVRQRLQVRFVGATGEPHGAYGATLRAQLEALGANERVQLLGPRDDIPALYAAADLALHASIRPEPFGLVVPEAMVQGIPVIASKFGGPGEVLTNATGRLFDPSVPQQLTEHLIQLVRDDALRQSLGASARAAVENYSIAAMVNGVTDVYDRL